MRNSLHYFFVCFGLSQVFGCGETTFRNTTRVIENKEKFNSTTPSIKNEECGGYFRTEEDSIDLFSPSMTPIFMESFECNEQSTKCHVTEHYGSWFMVDALNDWDIHRLGHSKECPEKGLLEIQKGCGIIGEAPPDGAMYAELDGHYTVSISRKLKTVPGQSYVLHYFARARDSQSLFGSRLRVSINGADLMVLDQTQLRQSWNKYQTSFVAQGHETILAFADAGISDTYGVLLDRIVVE